MKTLEEIKNILGNEIHHETAEVLFQRYDKLKTRVICFNPQNETNLMFIMYSNFIIQDPHDVRSIIFPYIDSSLIDFGNNFTFKLQLTDNQKLEYTMQYFS